MVVRLQLRCALLVMAVGAVGVGVNLLAGHLRTPTRRMMPEVAQIADGALVAIPVVLPYLVYVLARQVLPLLAARGRGVRGAYVAGSIVVHLLVSATAGLVIVASDPDFIFGSKYRGRVSEPSGTRVAYLFSSSFCDLMIYERAGGLAIEEKRVIPRRSCAGFDTVRVVWEAGAAEAKAVGPDGKEIGSQFSDFFLGPR